MITLSSIHTSNEETALTEIEALGLASQHDLANGHASQELALSQQRIISSLPEIWAKASKQKSKDAEAMFKNAFLRLANTPSLSNHDHFKICPTASNSIDTVATWLAEKKFKTALIEPTFDNLFLILKRRGVELSSLPEESLHEVSNHAFDFSPTENGAKVAYKACYKELFKAPDAIFLVNPNNPTGKVLTEEQFSSIVEVCAEMGKVLVLDNTFRFFVPQLFDTYKILIESGVTFLSIEDTGKVWPTQEIKASLLFASANIIKEIHKIYDEIFLCHSNFALGILAEFLSDAHNRGLDQAVWSGVAARRKLFRQKIAGSVLSVNPESLDSMISVEWVMIQEHFKNDLNLIEYFQERNLVLLPGRQFFWSKTGSEATSKFARFALLKPEEEFQSAINVLSTELGRLS